MTTVHSSSFLDDDAPRSTTLVEDVAMPIVIGGLVGLATGGVIWMMVVVHFGLMRWMWP